MWNPNAYSVLVLDSSTEKTLTGRRADIKKFVNEIVAVDTPEGYSGMRRSRYLKTKLREIVKGDFLYIDGDTIICGDLSGIDDTPYDVANVDDYHLSSAKLYPGLIWAENMVDLNMTKLEHYWNGGVIYAKDTERAHALFKSWHEEWKIEGETKNVFFDQPPLQKANFLNGQMIGNLGGQYNCMLMGYFFPYLADAKIIHYFGASKDKEEDCFYYFQCNSVYQKVKDKGIEQEEILKWLRHPKEAFLSNYRVIVGDDISYLDSRRSDPIYYAKTHYRYVYTITLYFCKVLLKVNGLVRRFFSIF
jgi:lipopolysaccharide biosynthesis glycosyltransferase